MAVRTDFSLIRQEDATLNVPLTPAAPIGAWNLRFLMTQRFGDTSGLITKSVASGYNAVSGITVTNSGQGVFTVNLRANDTSGLEYGNYAYQLERLDSGNRSVLTEGYLTLRP